MKKKNVFIRLSEESEPSEEKLRFVGLKSVPGVMTTICIIFRNIRIILSINSVFSEIKLLVHSESKMCL